MTKTVYQRLQKIAQYLQIKLLPLTNYKSMSQIKAQMLQQTIPLHSIRLIEAHRVFSLIQQNVQAPKSALTARNIEDFLNIFYFTDPQQKAVKVMYELNRQGLQMNDDKFAISLAKYLKSVELTNDESLNQFYKKVKEVLALNYQKPSQAFEKWDVEPLMSPQSLLGRQNNIGLFYNQLQPYIDGMQVFTFQSYLQRLNYCLSVISISSIEAQVFKVYKTFINPTVINHISDFLASMGTLQANQFNSQFIQNVLSQTDKIVRYFALLSYFYSACKYRELKEKLQTIPCLFYQETYKAITFAMSIPQNRVQRQVAVCLSLMSKYVDSFCDWILSSIDNYFMPLLNSIANVKDQQGAYYSLICLKYIIKRYQKKPQSFRMDTKNQKTMEQIQQFSFYLLKTFGNIELQKQCLELIAEILKVGPVNYKQIEQLKMTTKVFEAQLEYQTVLIPATLSILEVSIQRKLDDITNMIINDHAFLTCLQAHLTVKESVFFYQFLHIVYLLSQTHTAFLMEKQIFQKVIKMMFSESNPSVSSVGSEVLFNAVQHGLQNERYLELLYQKFSLFDRIIPFLFKKCFEKPVQVDCFMSIESQNNFLPQYNYFDKYMLMNVFKILYSLVVGVSRRNKKYAFSRRLNEEVIKSVSKFLDDLFSSENRPLVEIVLRERIRITNGNTIKLQNGIPLYKLINTILQEMTYNSEKKPIEILRIIDRQLKSYGENLLKSQIFSLHQLEVQNIPLYILEIQAEIPHKFELSSFKTYLRTFVVMGTEFKVSDVRDVVVRYKQNNRVIENQVQYRTIVNKALQNRVTEFEWIIVDIKWKNRRQEPLTSSFMIPNYNDSGMRSIQEPNMFANRMTSSRNIPNVAVSRYTTLRQNPSQHDARRSYYSPINFNYTYDRGNSPAFGGSGGNRNR